MNRASKLRTKSLLGGIAAVLASMSIVQGCGGDAAVVGSKPPGGGLDQAGKGAAAGSAGTSAMNGRGGSANGGTSGGATGGTAAVGGSGGTGITVGNEGGEAGQGGQAGGAPTCGATALNAARPVVNVLLVVDKSSSMSIKDEFPEGRWATLGGALRTALDQTKDRLSYGLEFFPFANDPKDEPGTCETPSGLDVLVPIDDGSDTVPMIEGALDAYDPAGGTPTADALSHALDYFQDGDGKALPGTSYVLLATDGGPDCNADLTCDADSCTINLENSMATMGCGGSCCDAQLDPKGPESCLDEDRTVDAVAALAKAGIHTFVVGIPGSQFFAGTLNKMAVAGKEPSTDGSASYYEVTVDDGAKGLADVLTRITTGLITTCRLDLTSTPPDLRLLNVEIDGSNVPQEGADGWSVDTATSPPSIVLEGKTCDYMEEHGAKSVNVTYGCPTVRVR